MISLYAKVQKHTRFFRRKSIGALLILCGISLFLCKDAQRSSRYHATLGNPVPTKLPIVDTNREIHYSNPYSNPFSEKIDSVDLHRIDSFLSLSTFPVFFSGRVDLFSQCFLGMPFNGEGPTGEGRYDTVDTAPIYNIRCFDCLTYVEHVLALALSDNPRAFLPNLVRLRYKDGTINYLHRNHFFVIDWLANNKDIVTLVHPKNGVTITRTISKKSFFARKHLTVPIPDTVVSVYSWSVEGFTTALAQKLIDTGVYIIVFIKKRYRTVIANHVGFVIITPRATYLRDANKTRGKVSESDLNKYLNHNAPRLEGILLARIITGSDPRQHMKTARR